MQLKEKINQKIPRDNLKEHEDKTILVYGTLTDLKKGAGQFSMLKDVTFHKVLWNDFGSKGCVKKITKQADHLWVEQKIIDDAVAKFENPGTAYSNILSCGYISEYTRKDGTTDYGIRPLPKNQTYLGLVEFWLFNLWSLSTSPERHTEYRDRIEEEALKGLKLVDFLVSDDSANTKLNLALIHRNKLLGIASLANKLLADYRKFKQNGRKKKKSNKGFGK